MGKGATARGVNTVDRQERVQGAQTQGGAENTP